MVLSGLSWVPGLLSSPVVDTQMSAVPGIGTGRPVPPPSPTGGLVFPPVPLVPPGPLPPPWAMPPAPASGCVAPPEAPEAPPFPPAPPAAAPPAEPPEEAGREPPLDGDPSPLPVALPPLPPVAEPPAVPPEPFGGELDDEHAAPASTTSVRTVEVILPHWWLLIVSNRRRIQRSRGRPSPSR